MIYVSRYKAIGDVILAYAACAMAMRQGVITTLVTTPALVQLFEGGVVPLRSRAPGVEAVAMTNARAPMDWARRYLRRPLVSERVHQLDQNLALLSGLSGVRLVRPHESRPLLPRQ